MTYPGKVGLHRRLSLCSLPVPKQTEGASGENSVAQPVIGGIWQPARCVILSFFLPPGGLSRCGRCRGSCKLPLPTIDREQINNNLAGYREGGPVAIPLFCRTLLRSAQPAVSPTLGRSVSPRGFSGAEGWSGWRASCDRAGSSCLGEVRPRHGPADGVSGGTAGAIAHFGRRSDLESAGYRSRSRPVRNRGSQTSRGCRAFRGGLAQCWK